MPKIVDNLDFNFLQALNMSLQVLASDPSSPAEGRIWWDSALHKLRVRDNSAPRSVITDDVPLNSILAPTGDVSMASHKITNLTNGSSPQDAVSFAQLELVRQGLVYKAAVEAAMTTNVTVSNPGTAVFDGQTLANGERLLLTGQTTGSENGIYVFNGSGAALTRADDADTFAEIDGGATTFAQGGTANGGQWRQGSELSSFSGQSWQKIGGGTTYTAGTGLNESPAGTFNVNKLKHTQLLSGASTSYTVTAATHGLGSGRDKLVRVLEESTGNYIEPSVSVASNGDVTLTFATAQVTNANRVVIV